MYNQVWQALAKQLYSKPNHWSLVKGSLAACIAYRKDNQWQAPDMHQWTAPDNTQWAVDFTDPDLPWEFTEQFQDMAEAIGWAREKTQTALTEHRDPHSGHGRPGSFQPCLVWPGQTLPSMPAPRRRPLPQAMAMPRDVEAPPHSYVADNSYSCRGIPPKSIYEVPGGGLEQVTGTGLWEPLQPIPTTNLVFGTDGSGGPASKDKRLRVQLCSSCLRQGHLARSGHPQRQHPRHPDSAPSRSHSTPLPSQVHHWSSGKQH